MSRNGRNVSIRAIISIVFILAMLLSISSIGSLIFFNWYNSALATTEIILNRASSNISEQMNALLYLPTHINEIHYKTLETGLLDISQDELRDKFFVNVLSAHEEEVYSFSYGTEAGEYYGARRNEAGAIEIMRNNAATGGHSWYYTVNEDMSAGEKILDAGFFDPRTRAWYQAAKDAGGPVLSPVYTHFVMNDLTISAAHPVYDQSQQLQGVLGAHMLLSGIGNYLEETMAEYRGYALIVEQTSGDLIANSLDINNFRTLPDESLVRLNVAEIENEDVKKGYALYQEKPAADFIYRGQEDQFHVSVQEIHLPGVDWLIITAIPQGLFMSSVISSINWTIGLVILFLLLSIIIYHLVMHHLLRPIRNLLQVAESLSAGDLKPRVKIKRHDEIGLISQGLNKVADELAFLINNLESTVRERTDELHAANDIMEANKDQLQLILNSTAEAIYGIDVAGNCTFCNLSGLKMLGYSSQSDLLGKNMHWQLHHSHPDGSRFLIEDCRILQSIKLSKGFSADDEVFWRADGSSFAVEYHAYPQIRDGKVIGAVVTFMDITERKRQEEEINYLNCHDTLTGLFNRRCFDLSRDQIDNSENLPISVIFADINGLKLTNDIFGHAAGDRLIKKSARILEQSCREEDIVARIGGDEFVILLPRTVADDAHTVMQRIREGFADARIEAVKCSISLGGETKYYPGQSLEVVMNNAENAMYKDKTANRNTRNKGMLDDIIQALFAKSPREESHARAVSELSVRIGRAMELSDSKLDQLKRAAALHDIGKITLPAAILNKDKLNADEMEKMRQHSVFGYRILNLFDDTLSLADYVYAHHERWNGEGYPRGLKQEQIPQLSRIIAIAETYDRVLVRGSETLEQRRQKAKAEIAAGAGSQFDPQIAKIFLQMMNGAEA